MLLSARMLTNVANVNTWQYTTTLRITQGDLPYVYFQLVDLDKDNDQLYSRPTGKRYMPNSGAVLTVTVNSIDDASVITKVATQPFSQDPSIWRFQLLTSDPVIGGMVSLRLELNEGGTITYGVIPAAISTVPLTSAYC